MYLIVNSPTQCDQTFPSCKRYQKAQILCSGVSGVTEVMFRDETSDAAMNSPHPDFQASVAQDSTSETDGLNQPFDVCSKFIPDTSYETSILTQAEDDFFDRGLEAAAEPSSFQLSVILQNAEIMVQYFFEQTDISGMWLSTLPNLHIDLPSRTL